MDGPPRRDVPRKGGALLDDLERHFYGQRWLVAQAMQMAGVERPEWDCSHGKRARRPLTMAQTERVMRCAYVILGARAEYSRGGEEFVHYLAQARQGMTGHAVERFCRGPRVKLPSP